MVSLGVENVHLGVKVAYVVAACAGISFNMLLKHSIPRPHCPLFADAV